MKTFFRLTAVKFLFNFTFFRFVGVVYPDDYLRLFTKCRITLTIFISWIFAPAALAPVFFFSGGGYGWNTNQTLCVFKAKSFNDSEKHYMWVSFVVCGEFHCLK